MITMTGRSEEDAIARLAASRMGVSLRSLSYYYDDGHEPPAAWTYSTAGSGSGSTVDAGGAVALRQARTGATNGSACRAHRAVLGHWADATPWYHFSRFRVGAINTLGGAAAPVSGTILATGLNSNADFTGDGVLFGIFGAGSIGNWVIGKQSGSVFTYQDVGIAHDLTATTPAAHEIHMWRDISGAHFFQLDDGAVTAISASGLPTGATARREIWGAQNAASGDANSRAFKTAINFYAAVET